MVSVKSASSLSSASVLYYTLSTLYGFSSLFTDMYLNSCLQPFTKAGDKLHKFPQSKFLHPLKILCHRECRTLKLKVAQPRNKLLAKFHRKIVEWFRWPSQGKRYRDPGPWNVQPSLWGPKPQGLATFGNIDIKFSLW